jgi:hypothetical protein
MLHAIRFVLPALSALALMACDPYKAPNVDLRSKMSLAGVIDNPQLSRQQKSAAFTDSAEQMLTPSGFMFVKTLADEAVVLDPSNGKAKILAAMMAPALELKGVMTRIEPLVKTRPSEYVKYAQQLQELRKSSAGPQARFLLDGAQDISTERGAQELVARFTARMDELRRVLNEVKFGDDIKFMINDDAFANPTLECVITQTGTWEFAYENCPMISILNEHRANRADLEAMQQVVAGYQTYLTVLNGWDLTGIYTKQGVLSGNARHDFEVLLGSSDFGTLRQNNGFGVVPDIMKDAVLGAHYAIEMQAELCPVGGPSMSNRPGFIFAEGFCTKADDSVTRTLALVESMLKGPVAIPSTENGKTLSTTVDAMSFFKRPIENVRSLAPYRIDRCGKLSHVGDASFGGVFPNGDLNDILARQSPTCL